jgi:RHS repeat-associated protein
LYNATSPDAGGVNDPIPKAYLTVLFFDERFNFIGEGSATDRVDAPGNGSDRVLVIDPAKAPRNGYAFVYLSNESDEHVYFDNLKVQLRHGHIIEENHYYAYGLRIAGISSRKMGDAREGQLANPYQYQGDYSEFDDETGWNDFALRSYDPQTGRFINADPYDQFASGYVGMGNDPINNVDPSGGFSLGGIVSGITGSSNVFFNTAALAVGGALVGGILDFATGGDGRGALIGAGIGGGLGLASGINGGGLGNISGTSIVSMGVHAISFGIDLAMSLSGPNVGVRNFQTNFNWEISVTGIAYDYYGFNETISRSQVGIGVMEIRDLDNGDVLAKYEIVSGPGDRGLMPDSPDSGYDYDGGIEETPTDAINRSSYEADDGFSFKMKHKRLYLTGKRFAMWIHPTKTIKPPKKVGFDADTGQDIYMVGTTDGCIGIIWEG